MAGHPQPDILSRAAWAVRLRRRDLAAAGRLRQYEDWALRLTGDTAWLAGPPLSREQADELAKVPCQARFRVDRQQRLVPEQGQVPVDRLPASGWHPLPSSLPPSLPPAALPAQLPQPQAIRMVCSAVEQPPAALVSDLESWQTFAEQAAAIRLRHLQFAVAADSRVLIVGEPLPPLPGTTCWRTGRLLLPAGWDLQYPAMAPVLPDLLGLGRQDLALFHHDASWEAIDRDNLITATRAGIRLSGSEPSHA